MNTSKFDLGKTLQQLEFCRLTLAKASAAKGRVAMTLAGVTDPVVCALMLADGRPEMVQRAIRSFRAQTYQNAWLLIFNSGEPGLVWRDMNPREICVSAAAWRGHTIGALRNAAITLALTADIIVHWDSDDWSHPLRIEEQVALLQASGKACVGYRDILFWDTREIQPDLSAYRFQMARMTLPEAWIYSNGDARYTVGASMCYWRAAWAACPFDDAPHEDLRWFMKNAERCIGDRAIFSAWHMPSAPALNPRMVCGIHGVNTEQYLRTDMLRAAPEWRRAPEWDKYCADVMRLERQRRDHER